MHEKLGVIFPIILICHNNILQVQKGRLQLLKHPLVGSSRTAQRSSTCSAANFPLGDA